MADDCRLYLLTPPDPDPAALESDLAEALDAGDIACVQIRLTGDDFERWQATVARLLAVTQARNVATLLEGRPDLVPGTGCDGVHVAGESQVVRQARKQVGNERIVGGEAGASRHDGLLKAEAGADYVSFGPCAPTGGAPGKVAIDPALVRWWACFMNVPCVCVGGLTVENASDWVATGAEFLAVSSGVWDHPDGPAAAVQAFERVIAETEVPRYGDSEHDGREI